MIRSSFLLVLQGGKAKGKKSLAKLTLKLAQQVDRVKKVLVAEAKRADKKKAISFATRQTIKLIKSLSKRASKARRR